MEDHDRLVDKLGACDQPVEGLGFRAARMADRVEFRRDIAFLEQASAHPGDHAVVLGMDADQRPALPCRQQHVEQRLVVDLSRS